MNSVSELNQKLETARSAYYAGKPVMSDQAYDGLERDLLTLANQTGEAPSVLHTVGTDVAGRIPHQHPMRSIPNRYSFEDVIEWAKHVGDTRLSLSLKIDGVSCSLTYDHGHLVKAVTRGDGDRGESILDAVRTSASIPIELRLPVSMEVRGELVIARQTMEHLNRGIEIAGGKPFVSARNLVAGTVRLTDLQEVRRRKVRFVPWEVLSPALDDLETGEDSAAQRLLDLPELNLGFETPFLAVVHKEELLALLTEWAPLLNDPAPELARDGIVIKVDSCELRRQLGYGSKFANFQVAYKAQNARAETVLNDVIWQVGRQGRLTPVGVVDPVVLAGATIERVTLNNASWIEGMGLGLGKRVTVVRSGDVIPKIVEVHDGE